MFSTRVYVYNTDPSYCGCTVSVQTMDGGGGGTPAEMRAARDSHMPAVLPRQTAPAFIMFRVS